VIGDAVARATIIFPDLASLWRLGQDVQRLVISLPLRDFPNPLSPASSRAFYFRRATANEGDLPGTAE
jgi:hypothetical protein